MNMPTHTLKTTCATVMKTLNIENYKEHRKTHRWKDGRRNGRIAGTVELKMLLCCKISKVREDEEVIRGMESFSAVVIATIRTAAVAAVPGARRHLYSINRCYHLSDVVRPSSESPSQNWRLE